MLFSESHIKLPESDLTVTFTDEGPAIEAPVIVFIHGFPFNKSSWDYQAEVLKDQYRVIAFDVRGFGNSDSGPDKFSIALFAGDMISLMDALGIDKATVCGLSMGGYIALYTIVNYPNRFESLILCDTQCAADTPEGKEKRMKAIESIRENGKEQYADESVKNLFAPESLNSRKEEVASIKEMILNTSTDSLYRGLHALADRDETCSKLSAIKVPVLIMVGSEDKITPPSAAKKMHEEINNSRIKTIENAGHISNMENHEEFNDNLIKFVTDVYKE